jgi:hypothetical protein
MNKTKNIKFNDETIIEFFKFLKKIVPWQILRGEIVPIKNGINGFKNPNEIKPYVTSNIFNAYACFNAGDTYDRYDKGYIRTDKERLDEVVPRIKKSITDIQDALNKHEKFNNIKLVDVTKEYQIVRTKIDRFDDGRDEYGVQVFWKFTFK